MRSYLRNITITLIFSLLPFLLKAQAKKDSLPDPTDYLSIGARNCFSSFFSGKRAFVGTGAGGQFGYRIAKNFNSHYFADWIVSNVANLAQRFDFHSGFSMMPEIISARAGKNHISLFPLAGICIDYTKLSVTTGKTEAQSPRFVERYSFACQIGFGATIPVSSRLDISLEAHYMLHIGTCVGINLLDNNVVQLIQMQPGGNVCLEGHYVLALSMDFKLFKL